MSLYDRIADRYDNWYTTPRGKFVDVVQKELVWDLAEISPGDRVLDMGCGTGNYTIELALCGCRVTGVDIAEGMLAEAKRKAKALNLSIDWLQADFSSLPFAAGTFDMVTIVTALEFANDPRGALLEAMRVLKPGGRLIAGVLTRNSAWGKLYQEEAGQNSNSVFAAARLFTEAELTAFLPCCHKVRHGLFIPPGPPEIDTAQAMSLESINRKQYTNTKQPAAEPGFLVARWNKPGTEGPQLACQLTLYPLGTSEVSLAVKKALRVLECYPVSYDIGSMSTVVRGSAAALWTAIWALADRSMEHGLEAVVQANVSNHCGCH